MHSKHHPNAPHTMSPTYIPHHSPFTHVHLTTRCPTWATTQATLILNLRDVSNPPAKIPGADVQALDANRQIHARWTDPGLVEALSRLHAALPQKANLSFKHGGRDVTAATWILVYQTLPHRPPTLEYVLWFHEYDDLDVEVGELADATWGVGSEEGIKGEKDGTVKHEELKLEDVGADIKMEVKEETFKWGVSIKKQEEVKVEMMEDMGMSVGVEW